MCKEAADACWILLKFIPDCFAIIFNGDIVFINPNKVNLTPPTVPPPVERGQNSAFLWLTSNIIKGHNFFEEFI